jgi:transposase
VRAEVRRLGIGAVIPTRSNQRVAYAGRNRVERCVNRLKQFRRVATRDAKRGCNYLAMVKLAAALVWL